MYYFIVCLGAYCGCCIDIDPWHPALDACSVLIYHVSYLVYLCCELICDIICDVLYTCGVIVILYDMCYVLILLYHIMYIILFVPTCVVTWLDIWYVCDGVSHDTCHVICSVLDICIVPWLEIGVSCRYVTRTIIFCYLSYFVHFRCDLIWLVWYCMILMLLYGWTGDPTPPHEWVETIIYMSSDDLSGVW